MLDMLEKEFQLLTDIEAGKALGGSSASTCPIASVSPVISSNNFVGNDGSNCYNLEYRYLNRQHCCDSR